MLSGMTIYSSNPVWRHILSELGAMVADTQNLLNINFDEIEPKHPISVSELKSLILGSSDKTKILQNLFGNNFPQLSSIQENIVVSLWRSGGMTGSELKTLLGHETGIATHTIDTAIYNLRRMCGHNFIQYENGVYKIGTV